MIEFLFPRRFRQWLGPVLVMAIAGVLLAIMLIVSGILQFPASSPDPQGIARLVHFTFGRSVSHHADDIAPPADLAAGWRVMAGAGHYARVCSSCHGAPGLGQNPIVLSMRPRPQYLPNVVQQYSAPQLFWILKHGVKFSGMPAWPAVRRDDEIWSVVAFLRVMAKTGPNAYRRLAYGDAPPSPIDPARLFGAPTGHHGYALRNASEPPIDEFAYVAPGMGLQDSALIGDPLPNCAGCHGLDGAGRAGGAYPNLAIQDPRYLKAALGAFASGQRFSGIMQTVATQLSPTQIDALARYYARQPRRRSNDAVQQPGLVTAGARIVKMGAANGVGACGGCHGVEGASPQAIPRLAGQNPIYFAEQMKLFRGQGRGHTGGYNPMNAASHNLTDAQIAAVTAFYTVQVPGTPAKKLK